MTTLIRLILAPLVALALSGAVAAQTRPEPQGPVILTVSGAVDLADADFDLALLEALPQRETRTATPWYEGEQTFTGPLLSDLMAAVGATGTALRIVALNDYATTVPLDDAARFPVILATRHNGAPMSVRDKGPLFVIYPFDEFPELHNEVYFSRSAWQVRLIEVLP